MYHFQAYLQKCQLFLFRKQSFGEKCYDIVAQEPVKLIKPPPRLAQLDKRRSAEREAADSNPNSNSGWINKQGN